MVLARLEFAYMQQIDASTIEPTLGVWRRAWFHHEWHVLGGAEWPRESSPIPKHWSEPGTSTDMQHDGPLYSTQAPRLTMTRSLYIEDNPQARQSCREYRKQPEGPFRAPHHNDIRLKPSQLSPKPQDGRNPSNVAPRHPGQQCSHATKCTKDPRAAKHVWLKDIIRLAATASQHKHAHLMARVPQRLKCESLVRMKSGRREDEVHRSGK